MVALRLRSVVAIASGFVTCGGPCSSHEVRRGVSNEPRRTRGIRHTPRHARRELRGEPARAHPHRPARSTCGLDDAAVARRVRKGHLHRVHPACTPSVTPGETLDAEFMAAVLAGGEAVLRQPLGVLRRCDGFVRWDGRRIDVTVARYAVAGGATASASTARARCCRATSTHVRGIPITTAARALLEIAPQLSDERLKRAVRQAQAEHADERAPDRRRPVAAPTATAARSGSPRSSPTGRRRPRSGARGHGARPHPRRRPRAPRGQPVARLGATRYRPRHALARRSG